MIKSSFYKQIVKVLLLLYLCLFYVNPISAQKDSVNINNYILIINSYTEAAPWSLRMISAVTEYTQNLPQLALYTENMNILMMDNDTILQEFKDIIFTKYKQQPPCMILLLGNPSLILRDDLRKAFGDIPILLCGEEDYFGPKEAYLKKEPIPLSERIPISDLAEPYNLVFLYSNLYIKENVDLVCQMIPNIQKFIFIGDERQINQTNNQIIKEELAKKHPEVVYQFLYPKKMSINQLLDSL